MKMKIEKKRVRQNRSRLTDLLLSTVVFISAPLISMQVNAQTKEVVNQDISTITQTDDYGEITGDGSLAAKDWISYASRMKFNTGGDGLGAYEAGNMPDINGTSVGLKAVDPVFDSTGKAVLTSTDNPPGMTVNSELNTKQKKGPYGQAGIFLDAQIDWTSDFTMTYGMDGSTAYGNRGAGLYFAPLRAKDWKAYETGETIPFPMGGTVLPTLTLTNPTLGHLISQIPNSFGLSASGQQLSSMRMTYVDANRLGAGYPNGVAVMFDPSNPGKTFTWKKGGTTNYLDSGYSQTIAENGVEIATPSEDFTSATYSVKYTASSGLLRITSSAKLPKDFTGIGNLASAAVGSTPVFQTTIPSQLKGQTYSVAIGKNFYWTLGIGYGKAVSSAGQSFPEYPSQPLTTSVKVGDYSFGVATSSVEVHYVDESGKSIAPNTTIQANVETTIGVNGLSPDAANARWSYDAKPISGYSPIRAEDVLVSKTDKNVLTITYEQKSSPATTTFDFAYDPTAQHTPSIPKSILENGYVGDKISTTESQIMTNVPLGYQVAKVTCPDGSEKQTIAEALKSYPSMTQEKNMFTVQLAPRTDSMVQITFAKVDPTQNFELPETISYKGTTGENLPDIVKDVNDQVKDNLIIKTVTGPNGKTYDNITDAQTENTYFVDQGEFIVHLLDRGEINLTVPHTIDFGINEVTSQTQRIVGKLDDKIAVNDSRDSSYQSNWSVAVAQSEAIHEVDATGETVLNGISFDGSLGFYDGTSDQFLSSSPLVIFNQNAPSTGLTDISDSWVNQRFFLEAPVVNQKTNTHFTGTLSWSLILAP